MNREKPYSYKLNDGSLYTGIVEERWGGKK